MICYLYIKNKSRAKFARTVPYAAASKTPFQIDSNQPVSKSRNEFARTAPNAATSKKPFQIDRFQRNNNQAVSKGDKFERYVVDKFDENKFTIVEWTTDTTRKHHRYVEADTRPDLLIRYNLTGEEFYVECKYRSYFYENKFQWSTPKQMNRYLRFAYEQNKPFFVVLGLGGTPDRPEKIFCIPIQEAKYPELYPSVLTKFSHETGKDFLWNGHRLN